MSNSNENNRPQISVDLGEVTASKRVVLVHASKRMYIKAVALLVLSEIVASATNHLEVQLQVVSEEAGETLIATPEGTEGGLPAYSPMQLALAAEEAEEDFIDLKKGQTLVAVLTVVGAGTLPAGSHIAVDAQIKGN